MASEKVHTTQMSSRESSGQPRTLGRRDFLEKLIWAALAVMAVEGAAGTLASLWPKAQSAAAGNRVTVGRPSDFPVGSVTRFPEDGFFLAHVDSGFLALSQVCTHLGCIVPWRPDEKSEDALAPNGRFNCPCHGSIFDRYGRVLVAPATRPMDLHPITLEGGKLVVDTGVVVKRQAYEASQAFKA